MSIVHPSSKDLQSIHWALQNFATTWQQGPSLMLLYDHSRILFLGVNASSYVIPCENTTHKQNHGIRLPKSMMVPQLYSQLYPIFLVGWSNLTLHQGLRGALPSNNSKTSSGAATAIPSCRVLPLPKPRMKSWIVSFQPIHKIYNK